MEAVEILHLPRRTMDLTVFGRIRDPTERFLDGCAGGLIPKCSSGPSQQLVIKLNGCSSLHVYILSELLYT
jgi:hypothetical protein